MDSCRLCAEEEESYEHLWLRCPAFIAERQRLGLGRAFDELVRIASAAENHLQAPVVTPQQQQQHHDKTKVLMVLGALSLGEVKIVQCFRLGT